MATQKQPAPQPRPAVRNGGSFAPPITDDLIEEYRALAAQAGDPACTEYMLALCDMVELFFETPSSTLPGRAKHATTLEGRPITVMMVPLEEDEKKRIFDAVPWPHELNMMGEQFKRLDRVAKRDVRRAAYHLLWYGRELCADREPITNDKLQ